MGKGKIDASERILQLQWRLISELTSFVRQELRKWNNNACNFKKKRTMVRAWSEIAFGTSEIGDYRSYLLKIYNEGKYFKERGFVFIPHVKEKPTQIENVTYNRFLKTDYWSDVRERILARDEYVCQMCGSEKSLVVHHKTYKHHKKEAEHLEDLVTLCNACHNEWHREESRLAKKKESDMYAEFGLTKSEADKCLYIIYAFIKKDLYSKGYPKAYSMRWEDYNNKWIKFTFGDSTDNIREYLLRLWHSGYFKDKDLRGYGKVLKSYQDKNNIFPDYNSYLSSSKWQKVRQSVIKRDMEKCILCDSKEQLNVHHITYDNVYNEINHLDDLVTLCEKCHNDIHGRKKGKNTIPLKETEHIFRDKILKKLK